MKAFEDSSLTRRAGVFHELIKTDHSSFVSVHLWQTTQSKIFRLCSAAQKSKGLVSLFPTSETKHSMIAALENSDIAITRYII